VIFLHLLHVVAVVRFEDGEVLVGGFVHRVVALSMQRNVEALPPLSVQPLSARQHMSVTLNGNDVEVYRMPYHSKSME
jgi:hypothetical protein